MRLNEALAELYGALIGDGCLSSYIRKDRNQRVNMTLFTGHLVNDINYYQNIISKIVYNHFKVRGYLYKRLKYTCVRYVITSNDIFKFFKDFKFPVGKKGNFRIHSSVMDVNKYALACLRGIFDTDGTIYNRYSKKYKGHSKHYNYAVIQFKLNNYKLMHQIKKILSRNGIKTTKIGMVNKRYSVLRITNQKEIEKFIALIKPHNKYHIQRYLNIISC